jgi:hypothetical protein
VLRLWGDTLDGMQSMSSDRAESAMLSALAKSGGVVELLSAQGMHYMECKVLEAVTELVL